MITSIPVQSDASSRGPDRTPGGRRCARPAERHEAAGAAVFPASDDASFIAGAELFVHGVHDVFGFADAAVPHGIPLHAHLLLLGQPGRTLVRHADRKRVRRGTHRRTRELEDALRLFVAIHSEDTKPLVWVKTADQILASIRRFCQRISWTGH